MGLVYKSIEFIGVMDMYPMSYMNYFKIERETPNKDTIYT